MKTHRALQANEVPAATTATPEAADSTTMRMTPTVDAERSIFWQKLWGSLAPNHGIYSPKHARARLVRAYTPEAGELGIAYKKYKLPNGITILLHEDHTNPETYVQISHEVGAGNENSGYSGLAHLYEHMMFGGTRHIADGEYDTVTQGYGGSNNAYTNFDETRYYQFGSSQALQLQLWLEAERLATITEGVTPEAFAIQRDVVKNERLQRYSKPSGAAMLYFYRNYFPEGHPYNIPPIGLVEDLDRATVDDMHSFYQRFYTPANMTLVVAGDFDEAETLAWIESYFSALPPGPKLHNRHVKEIRLEQNRYETFSHPAIETPSYELTFPLRVKSEKEDLALRALLWHLNHGAGSLMYDRFRKTGRMSEASFSKSQYEHDGFVKVYFTPIGDATLAEIEEEFRQLLEFASEHPPTASDLEVFVTSVKTGTMSGLQSYSKRTDILLDNAAGGDRRPGEFKKYFHQLESLTPSDLQHVLKMYFLGKPYFALSQVQGEEKSAAASTPTVEPVRYQATKRKSLILADPYAIRPEVKSERGQLNWPEPWETTLADGTQVHGITDRDVPVVQVQLDYALGNNYVDSQAARDLSYVASLFFTATATQSQADINLAFARLGVSVSSSSNGEEFRFTITAPRENLVQAMALFQTCLQTAVFKDEELQRRKQESLQAYAKLSEDPQTMLDWMSDTALYGAESSTGRTPQVSQALTEHVSIVSVQALYARLLTSPVRVSVAGDVTADDTVLLASLKFLSEREVVAAPTVRWPEHYSEQPQQMRIRFLAYPGAAQSFVEIGYRHDLLSPGKDLQWYYYSLLNASLGDGATGRLYRVLREEMGLTYGADSSFDVSKYFPNSFEANYSTPAAKTAESVLAAIAVLQDFHQTGPTETEWNAVLAQEAASLAVAETVSGQLSHLSYLLETGHSTNYAERILEDASALTSEQRLEMVQVHFDPSVMQVMVVGDPSVLADLLSLGYPIDVVDIEGKVLETRNPQ